MMVYYYSEEKNHSVGVICNLSKNTMTYLKKDVCNRYEVSYPDNEPPRYHFYEIITQKVVTMPRPDTPDTLCTEELEQVTESFVQNKIREWKELELHEEERYVFSSDADDKGSVRAAEIDNE